MRNKHLQCVGALAGALTVAILSTGCATHRPDQVTLSPLQHAAANGDMEAVKVIIEGGADVNASNRLGWTALNLVVSREKGIQTNALTQLLVDAGAKANSVPAEPAVTGKTFGVVGKHLKANGQTQEARACFAEARECLEKAIKKAKKEKASASRKLFWASVFEPMPTYSGQTYQQGAVQQNLTHSMGTLLFGGTSSETYNDRKAVTSVEVTELNDCLQECLRQLNP